MNPIHSETIPVFTKRGWMPIWRLGIAVTLSFVLMTIDARLKYLNIVRQALATLAFPIQKAASVPETKLWFFGQWFSLQRTLIEQNQNLQAELLKSGTLRSQLEGTQTENEHLRALLGLRPKYSETSIPATFLYRSKIPTEQKIIIDQGEAEGIKVSQAVIDSEGVLGQITQVSRLVSEVTLITDADYAVPVKVLRTNQFGVVYGKGLGHPLELRFATQDMDLKQGDRLVTSGIDGIYPENLPVAVIQRIERKTDTMFMRVECAPLAKINQHKHMLVFALPSIKERPIPEVHKPTPSKTNKPRRS
ncbi:MAG: rod shape-determining protein MreC [Pseudomonadota bacterium]